jgi:DNA polymerase epsilon subunit 3
MTEKMQELQLPLAVINRLIKEALPPNAIAKNEAKLGISKAASVFILFLTSGKFVCLHFQIKHFLNYCFLPAAADAASAKNQKTMTADHVLTALKEMEFGHMVPELESQLENYRKIMKNKKDRKSKGEAANTEEVAEEEADDDVVEVIDD